MKSLATPIIQVIIRKRPISSKEKLQSQSDIVKIESNNTVIVKQEKLKVDLTPFVDEYRYTFDAAYGQSATNEQIYVGAVKTLVECAFKGARVSCFACGQTGSGKTYTMLGDGLKVKGLYLLATADIFRLLKQLPSLSVWVSFYEIYCSKLFDLLNHRSLLFVREDAKSQVHIIGLSQHPVNDLKGLFQLIDFGERERVTAQNGTNIDSSRSHAVLQISLKQNTTLHGKISFIDLAGSERAADHADQLDKQTRIDSAQINKSLLALKECIRALDQNKLYTPFRGSKLTMVLRDSFVGYCRTLMIGNISPNSSSCENTLNTLKYADRVKQLKKPSRLHQTLDELSRELMLPRQNVRKVNTASINSAAHINPVSQNFITPHKSRQQRTYSSQNSHNFSLGKGLQVNNFLKPGKQDSKLVVPYRNKVGSANSPQRQQVKTDRKLSQNEYSSPMKKEKVRERLTHNPRKQNRKEFQSFRQLAQRHQNNIQRIIVQEQDLIDNHEKHINLMIELVKKSIVLADQADKVGSDIQNYLSNLQGMLDVELMSTMQLQQRVAKLRINLKESAKVQQIYLQRSKNRNRQDTEEQAYDMSAAPIK